LLRAHASRFRTTAALALVLTSGAGAVAACGSVADQARPAVTTATNSAATTVQNPVAGPARPRHRHRKVKANHPALVPPHLVLPPPPVRRLVTPSPARLERPVS
jgi:hypothetical protein